MMTDNIADSLTRIRNAVMRRLDTTELLHSKTIEAHRFYSCKKGLFRKLHCLKILEITKKLLRLL